MRLPWLLRLALRLILGVIFIYAGVIKARSPAAFADGIAAYRILPEATVNLFALMSPPFEVILGGWLIIGWKQRAAAFGAGVTLLIFLCAVASADARGLHIDCACFGPIDPHGWSARPAVALARDGLLSVIASLLYADAWRHSRSTTNPAVTPTAADVQGL